MRVPATDGGRARRMMVKGPHHRTLGCFFGNHPPRRRFTLAVTPGHPLADGLPDRFEVDDERYLLELLSPADTTCC